MRYERVYIVWDYYDGIRTGTADLNGAPHYFASLYDETADEYASNFKLYPVGPEFMRRALRNWEIYVAWDRKYRAAQANVKTHPGHRGIDREYDEHRSWLDDQIARLQALPTLYKATVRAAAGQEGLPRGAEREIEVAWLPSSV